MKRIIIKVKPSKNQIGNKNLGFILKYPTSENNPANNAHNPASIPIPNIDKNNDFL